MYCIVFCILLTATCGLGLDNYSDDIYEELLDENYLDFVNSSLFDSVKPNFPPEGSTKPIDAVGKTDQSQKRPEKLPPWPLYRSLVDSTQDVSQGGRLVDIYDEIYSEQDVSYDGTLNRKRRQICSQVKIAGKWFQPGKYVCKTSCLAAIWKYKDGTCVKGKCMCVPRTDACPTHPHPATAPVNADVPVPKVIPPADVPVPKVIPSADVPVPKGIPPADVPVPFSDIPLSDNGIVWKYY